MAEGVPIDVNAADLDELLRIAGIDDARARLILEYRLENGPFESWEEFEQLEGIGPAVAELAREVAVLGGVDPGEEEEEEEEEFAEDELTDVELLTTLARLDAEAALAYEAGAEAADDEEVARQLLAFREDHLRHGEELNGLLERLGGPRLERPQPGPEHLLRSLARLSGAFGREAVVIAMLANEHLTNGSYELAMEFDWDDDAMQVLQRAAADEERHFRWLSEKHEEFAEELAEEAAPTAQA